MKRFYPLVIAAGLLAAGCNDSHAPQPVANGTAGSMDSKVKAALAKLSPEDRALAEEQKYCASEPENRLGSMGRGGSLVTLRLQQPCQHPPGALVIVHDEDGVGHAQ